MAKEIKQQAISCSSHYAQNTEMNLSGNMADHIAVVQALQFALENKEAFSKKIKCPDCWKRMEEIQELLAKNIAEAQKHYMDHHAN